MSVGLHPPCKPTWNPGASETQRESVAVGRENVGESGTERASVAPRERLRAKFMA
jgi:hypothetical protein